MVKREGSGMGGGFVFPPSQRAFRQTPAESSQPSQRRQGSLPPRQATPSQRPPLSQQAFHPRDDDSSAQLDLSGEEMKKLEAEVMRHMLFKNYQQPNVPVRREELAGLITKTYKQRHLPSMIITSAQRKLLAIFGLEMKEYVRLKSSKASKSTNAASQGEAKEYVLESTIPENLLQKFVETPGMAAVHSLTLLVVGILKCSGGEKVPEETLMQNLERMGIREDDVDHPVFGNVKTALETLSKQRYIQKEKLTGHDGDGIVYELAERALDASFQRRYEDFLAKIVPRDNAD